MTNEALRAVAAEAEAAAFTGDPVTMAFTLGRIAEWALAAARVAEEAADATDAAEAAEA
ncbi:hypothetical protein [Falsiroseomonas sp.]|uniref:hypothetical protein n=1 Tax=Falsiroseomonas sp. TaxID=2870721 RepID=UPI003F6F86A1